MTPDEIIADFKRRYENTYVMVEFPDTKQEELFHVEAVVPHVDSMYQIVLTSGKYGQLVINYGSAHKLKFKNPMVGAFQSGREAYLYQRNPLKQYQRGVSSGNCTMRPVSSRVYSNIGRTLLTFPLVSAAFDHKTYSLAEALGLLTKENYVSVAIKYNYAVSQYMDKGGPYLLYYMDQPIALLDSTGKVTSVFEKAINLDELLPRL